MYVPLGVQPQFWFTPRMDLDSRLGPSPSIQALKVVRETNKKHIRFLVQHEQKLLQQIDPEEANHIYMQFGLERFEQGEHPSFHPSNKDGESGRRGDLWPITVVGLRSYHHPVAEIRSQSLATWHEMRAQYYADQGQLTNEDTSGWVVHANDAVSEAGTWTTQGDSTGDWVIERTGSDSCSEWGDDDFISWSDDEGDADSSDEERSDPVLAHPSSDHCPSDIPTPPRSDTCSPPPSPALSNSQLVSNIGVSDPNTPADSSIRKVSGLSASEELAQVLSDRKILETFLDGIVKRIVKRIKESSMSKAEREAEKADERQKQRPNRPRGQMPRGQERGDPKRSLRFHHGLIVSPEQAKLHKLEETCQSSFKTHFEMTHVYEDSTGKVYSEPVATEGLPPENQYKWMKAQRRQQQLF
ncbi:hypothetical protein diail_2072 [Diaporthe ilicicola]|nr:hypothetical protein diail_2072 [Diaporthe ilicicola]